MGTGYMWTVVYMCALDCACCVFLWEWACGFMWTFCGFMWTFVYMCV
jgi:hypothetical protein